MRHRREAARRLPVLGDGCRDLLDKLRLPITRRPCARAVIGADGRWGQCCGRGGMTAGETLVCPACRHEAGDCRCPPWVKEIPERLAPVSDLVPWEPEEGSPLDYSAEETGRPDTLLGRLLPGSAILDVPAVPDAVWGAGGDILWAAGQSLIIAGPDGVGKTTVAANLIQARLGLAKSVLDLPVRPGDRKHPGPAHGPSPAGHGSARPPVHRRRPGPP